MNNKYLKLLENLKNVGWYKGRNVMNIIETPYRLEYFPKNVLQFLGEYGILELKSDTIYLYEREYVFYVRIYTLDIIKQINDTHELGLNGIYEINDTINFDNDSTEYYYSTLIGTTLYWIAEHSLNKSVIYMDKFNNFYLFTDIGQLIWIASNPVDALVQLLYGDASGLTLNEETLKWIGRSNEPLEYEPPINKNLTENPW